MRKSTGRMVVRAATDGDTGLLVSLACEAYRDVVTRQSGDWNEREQAARFAAKGARLPFEVGCLASGRPPHAGDQVAKRLLDLQETAGSPYSAAPKRRSGGRVERRGAERRAVADAR